MRLLAVTESPPTTDPTGANGATLIAAHVLSRLPADVVLHLAYFADRPQEPDHAVLARADRISVLPVRGPRLALAAQALTPLPRGTWQRAGRATAVRGWSRDSDVTYLHGLHTFGLLRVVRGAVVVNEVDPWSDYWRERAGTRRGPRAAYDHLQAARARRLEALAAERASSVVVVNDADAHRMRARTGGAVVAVPNGTSRPAQAAARAAEADVLAFVGTLDYPPNVEAVTRLVRDVLPLVRRQVPSVRVLLAGRRPLAAVAALAGNGVQVLGDVEDVSAVFSRVQLAVYPGRTGQGTKNTVAEAVAAGCPVVASMESARGHATGDHLRVATTDEGLAAAVTGLLRDPHALRAARAACAVAAASLAAWDDVAAHYVHLLREAAGELP